MSACVSVCEALKNPVKRYSHTPRAVLEEPALEQYTTSPKRGEQYTRWFASSFPEPLVVQLGFHHCKSI